MVLPKSNLCNKYCVCVCVCVCVCTRQSWKILNHERNDLESWNMQFAIEYIHHRLGTSFPKFFLILQ